MNQSINGKLVTEEQVEVLDVLEGFKERLRLDVRSTGKEYRVHGLVQVVVAVVAGHLVVGFRSAKVRS